MGRVTQRVDPSALDDLLERPPRAAIAFVDGGRVEPVPVAYRRRGGRHWIGVAREALPASGLPDRAALLIDDGRWWFELRGVMLRGRFATAEGPPGGSEDLTWLELAPTSAAAWDYSALHEEADG
jgi:hypothetical protein